MKSDFDQTVDITPISTSMEITPASWITWASINGFVPVLRSQNEVTWNNVLLHCSYVPVTYTNSSIDFQFRYQQGHGGVWNDISIIINWDNKPVALWPLSLSKNHGVYRLSSHGLPVLPPLFASYCSNKVRQRVINYCLELAQMLGEKTGIATWESAESFLDMVGLSPWHIISRGHGATCTTTVDLFIDLRQGMVEIKAGFRKSYKSLVSSGLRHWKVCVLDSADENVWQRFQELHFKVAGRKTRSDETWNVHHRDIADQRAFLVYLVNADGEMDGGGFFNFTRDEGLYSVAAYKRELFDKPLGHLVQYRAIEEFKRRGVRWYKLGERPFRSDSPRPTDKEIAIGYFKHGFASHDFPCFRLTHYVTEAISVMKQGETEG